jgi:thiamine biosynthesis lipoprotein
MRRDAYDAIMVELSRRMPYITAFPRALGTGLLIHTARPLDDELHVRIGDFIDEYESVISRFRNDSLVAAMAKAEHGGAFAFPDWTLPLFMLCDVLAAASAGAIDPCIGEDMIRLGYGADLTFTMQPDAANHLGAIHGRPTWEHDVARDGTTLRTIRSVQLDFGACGKGYLVDLLGMMLCESFSQDSSIMPTSADTTSSACTEFSTTSESPVSPFEHMDDMHDPISSQQHENPADHEFLIDAGGDMLINSRDPIDIALEDPADTSNAVGIARISSGAFCASAPSRRHWGEAHGLRLHHLLNAIDGQPVNNVAATWIYVNAKTAATVNADASAGAESEAGTIADAKISAPSDGSQGTTSNRNARSASDAQLPGANLLSANSSGVNSPNASTPNAAHASDSSPAAAFPSILYPTALTDGLATALFVTKPQRLASLADFSCAQLLADRRMVASRNFPGTFFTAE